MFGRGLEEKDAKLSISLERMLPYDNEKVNLHTKLINNEILEKGRFLT